VKNIIIPIIVFAFVGCKTNFSSCINVNANVFTSFSEEVAVYDDSRKFLTRIKPDEEAGWILNVIKKDDCYFKVNFKDLDFKDVWILKGQVFLNTRNYDNQKIPLYVSPTKKSLILDYIVNEQTVVVEDLCSEWAFVKAFNDRGLYIKGWLESEMQCGNPYTTCN